MNSKALRQTIISLLLVVAVVVSQFVYDQRANASNVRLPVTYNEFIEPQPLSGSVARFVSFGATEFMADLYWLELIQYYGGGDPYGKYRKLPELFNVVTDLSPKFEFAYELGLITLPAEGFSDQAILLGKKGEQNLPENWQIPYNLGLVYHIYKKDYISGAQQFNLAASLPGTPANAKYFAAIYYSNANQRDISYQLFKTLSENSDNDFIKERSLKYVQHLDILFSLQDAVKTFQGKYGRNPESLQELVDKKIINEIPVSPLGISFGYDPQTAQITDSKS